MANPNGGPNWKKGMPSPNPGGRVVGGFTHSALMAIASDYLQTMTGREILALEADEKRFGKLTMVHQLVVRRITEAMRKDSEGRLNFAEVMDRLIGKPKQSIESEVKLTLEQLVLSSLNAAALPAPSEEPTPVIIDAQPVVETLAIDDVI